MTPLRARAVDILDVRSRLPAISPFSADGHSFDIGIFPLGFEDRVVAGAAALADQGVHLDQAIVPTYAMNESDNEKQYDLLEAELLRVSTVPLKRVAADDTVVNELDDVFRTAGGARVIVDISGASNSLVLRMLWCVLRHNVDLTVIYTEALHYAPSLEEYRAFRSKRRRMQLELATGTGQLESAVEIPGELDEIAQDCIVLIPGFDHDRARKVISFVDPTLLMRGRDQVHWILGRPHLVEDAWRVDLLREIHGVSAAPDGDWPLAREVSTFDFFETWRALEEIYRERVLSDRFTLSPMGSKLQAVGCALFCQARQDVRVVFASPQKYRALSYTSGVRNVWELRFGNTQVLRRTAEQVGELVVEQADGTPLLVGTQRIWG